MPKGIRHGSEEGTFEGDFETAQYMLVFLLCFL